MNRTHKTHDIGGTGAWSWATLTYPLHFEYKNMEGDWHRFYEAKNAQECQYRLSSFGLSTATEFTEIQIVDGNGEAFFNHTKEEMHYFNEDFRSNVIKALVPLKTFVNSAPKESIETAMELITGALNSQHFTIPSDAIVKLKHEVISKITLQEFHDCVICRVHIHSDPYDFATPAVTFWKEINNEEWLEKWDPNIVPESACQPKKDGPGFAFTPFEVHNDIKGFLILLCGAIVRDFWVLEERSASQTYTKHTNKTRQRTGRGKDRKLKVKKDYTFIPRFQYDLESYKVNKTIQHQTRVTLSPHLVSGHIRQLPEGWEASETSLENAQEFGITLSKGQTFVIPHERGQIEQLRTYRSKSAMQMLFGGQE